MHAARAVAPVRRTVSIVMPVRQEGEQFDQVLAAVAAQDEPHLDRIIVAVGPSTDGTRERAEAWARRNARFCVIDNPDGIVSTALNRALEVVESTYVVRVDGHCVVPPDYVRRLLATQEETGADCVGPRLRTLGTRRMQRAIAAAMSSTYGVGSSRFRTSLRSGDVDTVAFGLYDCERLRGLGGFRTDLVRNQDDELNARLRRAGGRVYMDASLCVDYFPRSSLKGLWRQYFEYGYWRTVSARAADYPLRPRQLAPGALVGGLALATVAAAAGRPRPLLAGGAAYAAVLTLLVAQTTRRTSDPVVGVLSGSAGAVLHLAYGSGLWWSALRGENAR